MTRSHRIDVTRLGPLIQVGITVGIARAATGLAGPPASVTALIDTGASQSAIRDTARRSLSPQYVGRVPLRRAAGVRVLGYSYAIRLKFEGLLAPNPWFDLNVVQANPATPGVDILIGMDLIEQLVTFHDGPRGSMILCY